MPRLTPTVLMKPTDIDFYEPVANESRYGAWCQGCHTDFHGNSADPDMHNAEGWIRHPAAEANIGGMGGHGYSSASDFGSHAYRPQVMSPTGDWGTQGDSTWTAPDRPYADLRYLP